MKTDWDRWVLLQIVYFQIGTINGLHLGMEKYLPKYMQGDEAVIVNVSSYAGLQEISSAPVYTATKHAVLGLVKSWGVPEFYEDTKVRVLAICPGFTLTSLLSKVRENYRSEIYRLLGKKYASLPRQE